MQIVEGTITGNTPSSTYNSVPDPVNNPALVFRKRIVGGETTRLPCSEIGNDYFSPAMDWCAEVIVNATYTVLYRTRNDVDSPLDKCKSLGLLQFRENGTAEFTPYQCAQPPLQHISGCPNGPAILDSNTLSKSNCGVEILKVPAVAAFPPIIGPGTGDTNEIGVGDEIPSYTREYIALFIYKPKDDVTDYCEEDCRTVPPPTCITNQCLGFKVTYIDGTVNTRLRITAENCCGDPVIPTLVDKGATEAKIICVKCGTADANKIIFAIENIIPEINDAVIKEINSSVLYTEILEDGGEYIEVAGIHTGITYKVEIVDTFDRSC